jgi:hypothetical protein
VGEKTGFRGNLEVRGPKNARPREEGSTEEDEDREDKKEGTRSTGSNKREEEVSEFGNSTSHTS